MGLIKGCGTQAKCQGETKASSLFYVQKEVKVFTSSISQPVPNIHPGRAASVTQSPAGAQAVPRETDPPWPQPLGPIGVGGVVSLA